MSYIIYLLLKITEGLLVVIGIPLFVIIYPLRHLIIKYPTLFKYLILYWFTNSDEDNYIDNWYGVYELIDDKLDENGNVIKDKYDIFNDTNIFQKIILSFKWVALRNPHWNLKLVFGKIATGEIDKSSIKEVSKTIGDAPKTTWRNKTIFGRQYIRYNLKNKSLRLFRYSFTRKIKKWSPLKIFGYNYVNIMFGYSTGRVISKWRMWK